LQPKIRVASYSWSSQIVFRTGPIPMLDEMPITSAVLEYYLKLSGLEVGRHEAQPTIVTPVVEGVIAKYNYHTLVEVSYSRLYAVLLSGRVVSCLRYLECLVEKLREYGDWSYRASLDYNRIREEEILSTIKRVEAKVNDLFEALNKTFLKSNSGGR
jgi:hypothetical protein